MQKILLLLILSISTQAVEISKDNLGQVLIFPYYTVNGEYNTLISVSNTDNLPKAIRVRFREAFNAREVLTFNLYLGVNDTWTAALLKQEENVRLIAHDKTCTVPLLSTQETFFYKNKFVGELADNYGDDNMRLYEGFVEVIEMGQLTENSALATYQTLASSKLDCDKFIKAWNVDSEDPYWITDAKTDLLPPSGGLMGNIVLINVAKGIAVNQKPTVLNKFSNEILHYPIKSDSPNLADGMHTATSHDSSGVFVETQWNTGYEAVTSVLMSSSIINEYILNPVIRAKTDWILTQPTRHFHTDNIYGNPLIPTAPYTNISNIINCERMYIDEIYSRESQVYTPDTGIVVFPPANYDPLSRSICHSTNNFNFRSTDSSQSQSVSIFQSNVSQIIESEFNSGWVNISNRQSMQSNNNVIIKGLPIIGFSVNTYTNGNIGDGILANYGGLFHHKLSKEIVDSVDQNASAPMKISGDGIGQVLIFPYYSVRNGMNTLLSVINTTDQVKVLKVSFKEGKNARTAFNFNLYLSSYDVWTAALASSVSTLPDYMNQKTVELLTSDRSCTVPKINHLNFTPFGYENNYDNQGHDLERVQEGFVEIIVVGSLLEGSVDALDATNFMGYPRNCNAIIENWSSADGKWVVDPTTNIIPSNFIGGISGSISLIDIPKGIDMTYDATAIQGFTNDSLHSAPGSILPNLSSGTNQKTLIDIGNTIVKTTWNSSIDAVTALFMRSEINNEYDISPEIGAHSQWINTYPTKQFYVDPFFSHSENALEPFNTILVKEIGNCEKIYGFTYSREQKIRPIDLSFQPGPTPIPPGYPYRPNGCRSIDIMTFTHESTDSGSLFDTLLNIRSHDLSFEFISRLNPLNIFNYSKNGQLKISYYNRNYLETKLTGTGDNGEIHEIFGKPVLGFVAQKFSNGMLMDDLGNNILANYAYINRNKSKIKIEITANTIK